MGDVITKRGHFSLVNIIVWGSHYSLVNIVKGGGGIKKKGVEGIYYDTGTLLVFYSVSNTEQLIVLVKNRWNS